MSRKITSIAAALATTATLAVAAGPASADVNDIKIGNRSQFVQSYTTSSGPASPTTKTVGRIAGRPQTLVFKPGQYKVK